MTTLPDKSGQQISTVVVEPVVVEPLQKLTTNIATFHEPLATYLKSLNLPIEGVLSPIEERRTVIEGLGRALDLLEVGERQKSVYLSRFAVSICAGLFDGAINYLWNETISALRRMVDRVDLSYFYSVAGQINAYYSRLSTTEELADVSEHDLLEACRRMGLLTDVNHKRLEFINYMRNHASAAHPNNVEVSGFDILSWLTNCLKFAITAEPERSVITIKQLLGNIRTKAIPASDYPLIGKEIARLSPPQIDDFLSTIFGMYTDPRVLAQARDNILGIAPFAWRAASEDRKFEVGSRFGVFRKNGDTDRKTSAEAFLTIVDGLSYRDEDSLAADLLVRLQALKTAHFGDNNFYNEWPHAEMLERGLPASGEIPRSVRPMWVKVISLCFVGNGHGYREGTDERAMPYYVKHIKKFGEAEIAEFLHLFGDVEFNSALERKTPDRRLRHLAKGLRTQTSNVHQVRALDFVVDFPALKLDRLPQDERYARLLENVQKHA